MVAHNIYAKSHHLTRTRISSVFLPLVSVFPPFLENLFIFWFSLDLALWKVAFFQKFSIPIFLLLSATLNLFGWNHVPRLSISYSCQHDCVQQRTFVEIWQMWHEYWIFEYWMMSVTGLCIVSCLLNECLVFGQGWFVSCIVRFH